MEKKDKDSKITGAIEVIKSKIILFMLPIR